MIKNIKTKKELKFKNSSIRIVSSLINSSKFDPFILELLPNPYLIAGRHFVSPSSFPTLIYPHFRRRHSVSLWWVHFPQSFRFAFHNGPSFAVPYSPGWLGGIYK